MAGMVLSFGWFWKKVVFSGMGGKNYELRIGLAPIFERGAGQGGGEACALCAPVSKPRSGDRA
jgi:hypothetical protein